MRKKIFYPGIEIDKKNSGYALIFAVAFLFVISLLPCSFCVLSKLKLQNLEKRHQKFYQNLEKENKEVLENWKNSSFEKEISGGKNEID